MITLNNDIIALDLVPEIGGSIAALRYRGRDVMRPLSAAAAAKGDVLGVASFPMLPYANRIDGNAFSFEGRTFQVAANNGAEPYNVHGSGWQSAWTVEAATTTTARLGLDHAAGPSDPYAYRATQGLTLEDDVLVLATTIENRREFSMPFGFGHHPWFPRDADATLRFRAGSFWLEGPLGIPSDRISLPPELDFAARRPLPSGWRNNNYSGWDGAAELRFPTRGIGLVIEADAIFASLMLYADPGRDVFCLEPQTNVPCAFNRMAGDGADLGVIVLAPGEQASGTIRFRPFAL